MTREEGIALVSKAIRSGIFNDLGSGSNVDICVIEADDKVEYMRNTEYLQTRTYEPQHPVVFKPDSLSATLLITFVFAVCLHDQARHASGVLSC